MKKVLLISGGFDSLLISEMKSDSIDFYANINYGHRFFAHERNVLKNWQYVTGKAFLELELPDLADKDGFFFGRNLRFLILVREYFLKAEIPNIGVYFGNNADDNYNDNTREFLARAEKIINDSYPGTMRVICPLENNSKQEIIKLYKATDLHHAGIIPYFCDSGEDEPCRKCHSCIAMMDAGVI